MNWVHPLYIVLDVSVKTKTWFQFRIEVTQSVNTLKILQVITTLS